MQLNPITALSQPLAAATTAYEKAVACNPLDDSFISNLGLLYFYAGNTRKAERFLRRALALNSYEPIYYIEIGAILDARAQTVVADHEYALSLSIDPGLIDSAFFNSLTTRSPVRARAIINSSILMLQTHLARTHSPIIMGRLGALLLKAGYSKDAVPLLQKAVANLPGLPSAWDNLGVALKALGQEREAERALTKAEFLRGQMMTLNGNDGASDSLYSGSQPLVTEHANRVARLYMTNPLELDDILPPGILNICKADDLHFHLENVSGDQVQALAH